MALPTYYNTGTVSVTAGSTTVTGVGTSWAGNIYAGDMFYDPAQPLVPPLRIATDPTDTTITLAVAWAGSNMSSDAYEVLITPDTSRVQERTRRVLALLGQVTNTGIGVDAIGEFADLDTYGSQATAFAFLSLDGDGGAITDPVVFVKNTGTTDDWSDPILIAGPAGPQGDSGVVGVWKGAYSGATAYVEGDVVRQSGSAWIALGSTTGNAPPTLPTTSNTYWELVAQKGDTGAAGADGTGTGDMLKADNLSGLADYATARSNLGLTIGTHVQAYDADLTAIAGLTSAADKVPYFTGSGAAALADFTSAGRALVDDADAAAQRTTLGVAIGADVQAYSARLAEIVAIGTPAGDRLMMWDQSAADWVAATLAPGLVISGTEVRAYEVWGGAISDETTAITTGTAKLSFSIPYQFKVAGVYATLNTVSSSGTPTFDINEGGTTILSTKIVIDASEYTGGSAGYQGTAAAAAVISDDTIAAFAQITVDVDTAGTGAKGAKVFIIGYRNS